MKEEEKTQVIALRIPKPTYDIIMKRSQDWEMSVSFLLREIVIKVFSDDNTVDTMKSYKKKRRGN